MHKDKDIKHTSEEALLSQADGTAVAEDGRKVFLKKAARYALTPGIIPRFKELFGSGFGYLAHLVAYIFYSVRLLPAGHAYINPRNIGRFGVHHVLAEAAHNLEFKRKNIDQIVIFGAIMIGMVALLMQVVLFGVSLTSTDAFSAPIAKQFSFQGLFHTPGCQNTAGGALAKDGCKDIAFMFLDSVFGIPDLYNSKNSPTHNGGISNFHTGLHELIRFYNLAILVVAVLIFLYYVVLIVGETAATGTPFGRRFNHIWAPLRLVIAVGFLVPLNYGFNSAQYITLFSAKYGSSFATNAWHHFNDSIYARNGNNPVGIRDDRLITNIKTPDVTTFVQAMAIINACRAAYEEHFRGQNAIPVKAYLVRKKDPVTGNPSNDRIEVTAQTQPQYDDALKFYGYRDVYIRFGRYDPDEFDEEPGYVEPTCGEVVIKTNALIFNNGTLEKVGSYKLQQAFYKLVSYLYSTRMAANPLYTAGKRYAAHSLGGDDKTLACDVTVTGDDPCTPDYLLPGGKWKKAQAEEAQGFVSQDARRARDTLLRYLRGGADVDNAFKLSQDLYDRGWGGAAIWYNQIAEWNGGLMASSIHPPRMSREPVVMEKVSEELRAHVENLRTEDQYLPFKPDGQALNDLDDDEIEIADVLALAHYEWAVEEDHIDPDKKTGGNIVFDMMNLLFGTSGLFDIRSQNDIHPLAQLSAIGRGMIESAMFNIMIGLSASAVGGVAKQMEWSMVGGIAPAIGRMFVSFATISLTIGFTLYYVLPFLPFIYFFFALGKWVKGIFEAMVGVPLWALAHLKVDGNGLPGESALNGYFLIFEIFIRPILVVFGLIGSIAIFGALAQTLNEIFDIVVHNMTGFDCTGMTNAGTSCSGAVDKKFYMEIADELFFTIIYTIIIYIMAQSSFKMIDAVPNQILRWMGAGVSSFGDQSEDAAENIASYAAIGTRTIGGQVLGAAQSGADVAGQGVGLTGRMLMAPKAEGNINVAGNTSGPGKAGPSGKGT